MFNTSSGSRTTPNWRQALRITDEAKPPSRLFSWTLANFETQPATSAMERAPEDILAGKKRIHIVGVGDLGRLFATSLSKLPRPPPITLVLRRKEQLEQWAANPGLEIIRPGGITDRLTNFDVEWWTEEKPEKGPVAEVNHGRSISNLLVTTKAQDAMPQVDRLRGYLDRCSTVASVQNGMSKLWPPQGKVSCDERYPINSHPNFISCVTTHGVTSLGTFKSLHASPAGVAIGPVLLNQSFHGEETPNPSEYLMGSIMEAPHLNARRVSRPDLWVLQLEKLFVNSVINPLTAILRCKNGNLFVSRQGPIAHVMGKLLSEASEVLVALAEEESTRQIYAEDEGRTSAHAGRFSNQNLNKMLWSVGEKVKDNRSSMLQDVEAGKSTEIREFNGWLVETAASLQHQQNTLTMDTHKTIIELVEQGVVVKAEELGRYFP